MCYLYRGYHEKQLRKCRPKGKTAAIWREKLRPSKDVPRSLRQHYSVAKWFQGLEGAMLSQKGVANRTSISDQKALYVCIQCYTSMKSGNNPPKFSIANGFDIGKLPGSLADSRDIGKRLRSLTSIVHSVKVLRGGRHKVLKGHVSVMRMSPSKINEKLPKLLNGTDETFLVIMAGTLTPLQTVIAMKRHQARTEVVRGLLEFFVRENILFQEAGVKIDEDALQKLSKRNGDPGVLFENITDPHEAVSLDGTVHLSSSDQGSFNIVDDIDDRLGTAKDLETKYEESSSIFVDNNPQTSVEVLQEAQKALLVRNSGPYLSYYNKNMLGLCFPDLFPYGRGHPGTIRRIPVSTEECCRYYLNLADRRFAQHPSFLLIVFDLCGKQRVINSTCVRSFCRLGEFERFGSVTKDELSKALREKRRRREDALAGRPVLNSKVETDAESLLRHVKVSQSCMWGSSEEKIRYRRQAFSMDAYLKTGAIFVTITPSDTSNLCVSAIAGRVCHKSMLRLEKTEFPSYMERAKIAGTDPLACSEYFEMVCDTFFEEIVGFHKKSALPYKSGGVFGHVKAYFGVAEAQSSGNLHLHAILFVAGLPRTAKEFVTKCEDETNGGIFKSSMCALIDSIISASLPCSPVFEESPECPSCHEKTLVPRQSISEAAFRKQGKGLKPHPTSDCSNCNAKYGGSEIIRAELKRLHSSLDEVSEANRRRIQYGENYKEDDRLTENHCIQQLPYLWPPNGESVDSEVGKLHRLLLGRIVLLTQQHSHLHVNSCFKASISSKKGHCRYGFPRIAGLQTTIDDNLLLNVGRRYHNEYINCFNDVMALTFAANHDIRFLLGGTTDAVYYVMKYVTKGSAPSPEVERTLMESFERRRKAEDERKADDLPVSLIKTGRARVNSMAAAFVKMQEVPSPMCALYMRRKTVVFASHSFGKLLLGQIMSVIRSERHESDLIPEKGGRLVAASQYLDYVCRSSELEDLCLMEFVAAYYRVQASKANTSRQKRNFHVTGSSSVLRFIREHPLFETHGLRKRNPSVIPDIIGPRMPDREHLTSTEKKEEYGLMALILLFPFRLGTGLRQGTSSYWKSYQMFSKSEQFSQRCRVILENFQEYYVSKHSSPHQGNTGSTIKEIDETDEVGKSNYSFNDQSSDEEAGFVGVDYAGIGALHGNRNSVTADVARYLVSSKGFQHFCSPKIDVIANHGTGRRCVETLGMKIINRATPWKGIIDAPDDSSRHNWVEPVPCEYDSLDVEYKNASNDNADFDDEPELIEGFASQNNLVKGCDHRSDEDTTVMYLSEAVKELENKCGNQCSDSGQLCGSEIQSSMYSSSTNLRCGHYASISSLIEKYSLNSLQRKAFKLVAEEFLLRMAGGYGVCVLTDDRCKRGIGKPFSMYLGGEGGTGKTRVVEALLEFCKSWKRPKAIRTCAPTGMAASLVDGQKLHSLLGIRGGGTFNAKRRLPKKTIEVHEETLLIIIDEISMLTRSMLAALDAFLRKTKEMDVSYGGVMVLFCGDFFQIPPVLSDPVYVNPNVSTCQVNIADKIGFELWQGLDHAIVLTKSMRQKDDNPFSECLRRVRNGNATKQDLKILNSRVLGPKVLSELQRLQKEYVPLIVRSNALRVALNWGMIKAKAKALQFKPIICVAQINCRNMIKVKDLETIFRASDNETGNISVLLPLLPGMPVRLTHNIAISIGIANGTLGFLEGVSFPQQATFSSLSLFGVECVTCDMLPKVAYISSPVFSKKLQKRFPHLPSRYQDDTLPVVPTSVEQIAPKLRKRLECKERISFKQLPFVPAYASTTYKVQGITADGVVVFPLFKECNLHPPKATLYVVLSRVRMLSSLFLLEELTEDDLKYFSPTDELLEEETRLNQLHQRTVVEQSE